MSTFRIAQAIALLSFLAVSFTAHAEEAEWIWHPNDGAKPSPNEVRYFRKTFTMEPRLKRAILSVAADDEAQVWLNGTSITTVNGWQKPAHTDITWKLKAGENVLAIRARNDQADAAGVVVRLQITNTKKLGTTLGTDATWLTSKKEEKDWNRPNFEPGANWIPATSLGKLGTKPWGDIMKVAQATRAEDLTVSPGFKVELLRSAQPSEGSWICMSIDPKGRLIISPQQDDLPLLRVTLTSSGKIAEMTPLVSPVRQAMGMCWAHNSFYANAHGPKGTGLYRMIDQNKNDQFETNEIVFYKKIPGEGEHGYHALVPGPDGNIYMMNGNHTKVPEGVSPDSPHRNYQEDFLLPRQWDAGGHAVGILAPGGYVVRIDPEGKKWDLMLAGFRNSYDFDINADGEMFTFDSDMEWEWGMPWYRPTRILHCVSGAEFGWRSGSAKWPEYYADSLPATLNIAIGSPTGTKFGTKSNYPEKYKRAFYAMDWSYGRIFAVHLKPDGASYSADSEVFVKGKPLNVTDLEFGRDGAMYFITGGRGTQAGLYRVSHVGSKSREPRLQSDVYMAEAAANYRKLRHLLETFHGKKEPAAVDIAWPYLGNSDRFIRYAARIAVESQELALWKDRAINEADATAGLNALLALARIGGKDTQKDLLMALKKFPLDTLGDEQKLEKLRVIQLSFIRQGKPEPMLAKLAMEKLGKHYPSTDSKMNRELSQLLIFLEAPDVVEKTFALLDKAETHEEKLHYIFALRNLRNGWTLDQRKKYFEFFKTDFAKEKRQADIKQWFAEAERDYADGASFTKHLTNIKKEAIAILSEDDKLALGNLVTDPSDKPEEKKPAKERKFVKDWKMSDLENALDGVARGRNFESGKNAFRDAQCILCHRFGNDGGNVGPELTAASSKYTRKDILDSILEPSKIVSEQFQNETVWKKDGEDITGRVVDENDVKIVLNTNPLEPEKTVEIKKSDIDKRTPSKVSSMPEGLVSNLNKEEILDMLAYIESAGRAKADNFKKDERAGKK